MGTQNVLDDFSSIDDFSTISSAKDDSNSQMRATTYSLIVFPLQNCTFEATPLDGLNTFCVTISGPGRTLTLSDGLISVQTLAPTPKIKHYDDGMPHQTAELLCQYSEEVCQRQGAVFVPWGSYRSVAERAYSEMLTLLKRQQTMSCHSAF